jgi:hypothetical protein
MSSQFGVSKLTIVAFHHLSGTEGSVTWSERAGSPLSLLCSAVKQKEESKVNAGNCCIPPIDSYLNIFVYEQAWPLVLTSCAIDCLHSTESSLFLNNFHSTLSNVVISIWMFLVYAGFLLLISLHWKNFFLFFICAVGLIFWPFNSYRKIIDCLVVM